MSKTERVLVGKRKKIQKACEAPTRGNPSTGSGYSNFGRKRTLEFLDEEEVQIIPRCIMIILWVY